MKTDFYTKFILTIIAFALLGINLGLFSEKIIKPAYAASVQKVVICDKSGLSCAKVNSSRGLAVDQW